MKLSWNVYIEDINRNKISTYNIFDHVGFRSACEKVLSDYFNDTDFDKVEGDSQIKMLSDKIHGILLYYFWSKTEYEVFLTSIIHEEKCAGAKVSIYDQVMLNFSEFIWYIVTQTLFSLKDDSNNE